MPVVPGFRSEWNRYVYDTVAIAHTVAMGSQQTFFTAAIGQGTSPTTGSGTKQIQDTNLTEPRKLPFLAGDAWIKSIGLEISGVDGLATPNDVRRLFKHFIGTLLINNDDYLQGPLVCYPAGGGPFHTGQLSTAMLALTTNTFGMSNGLPSASAAMILDKPVGIGQGETFEFQLNGSTFTTDAAAGTTLGQGLLLRCILNVWAGQAASQ